MSEKSNIEQALDLMDERWPGYATAKKMIREACLRASGDVDRQALKIECEKLYGGSNKEDQAIWGTIDHLASKGLISRESAWMGISSVPKDGSRVLVYFKGHGWLTVRWTDGDDDGPTSEYAHWHTDDFKHGPYPIRGYSLGDEMGWMPLPARPLGDKL